MRVVIAGYGVRVFGERRNTDVVVRSVVIGHGDTVTRWSGWRRLLHNRWYYYRYIVTAEGEGGIAGWSVKTTVVGISDGTDPRFMCVCKNLLVAPERLMYASGM